MGGLNTMATVHMTFTDTDAGGVEVHSDFQPAIGKACTKAQAAALEIFNRTRKEWGMAGIEVVHMQVAPPVAICACQMEFEQEELDKNRCASCGKALVLA
jgi:hypothetical protein